MEAKDIEGLRRSIGTAAQVEVSCKTEFYRGVEGITVRLIDGPNDPYRMIYEMAVSTWVKPGEDTRWERTSPEHRYLVVKAVLEHQALPLALEYPTFGFVVDRCSRSAFDQLARARIGVTFASMGWRDLNHSDIGFRVPEAIWNDSIWLDEFKYSCLQAKYNYHQLVQRGQGSWQDARAHLPISAVHRFSMSINYAALMTMCSKRMKCCEQQDTVAVAWLLREALMERYPLLASYLRPGCDWGGRCQYHQANTLSELFGCLFAPCGRNPVQDGASKYAQFNEACSDRETIARQLGISIPVRDDEWPVQEYWELEGVDREAFERD